MSSQGKFTAAELDRQEYLSAREPDYAQLLAHAAKSSSTSVFQVQRAFRKMAKSHSRLNMVEFVRTGLYHTDRFTDGQRETYISNDLHWPITHLCCHNGWNSVAEDKALAATLLTAGGVPVPDTVGVIDRSQRLFPGLRKIDTVESLREVVLANLDGGLFGKIVEGMVSFGAFKIKHADQDQITCYGQEPVSYETFLNDFVGSNSYVLQRVLKNHSSIDRFCSALATVRMVNLITDQGVYCPLAIIKLPQRKNIADAFWRKGNLACEVDYDSGQIKTVARRTKMEVEYLEDHPDNPGLMGMDLPHWDELKEINARAAQIFAPIRYQSTDIALTEDGPVIVELNYGGGFDLPQYASGRGMLTPEVRAFFESFGYDFDAPKKKRMPLFRRN